MTYSDSDTVARSVFVVCIKAYLVRTGIFPYVSQKEDFVKCGP